MRREGRQRDLTKHASEEGKEDKAQPSANSSTQLYANGSTQTALRKQLYSNNSPQTALRKELYSTRRKEQCATSVGSSRVGGVDRGEERRSRSKRRGCRQRV